MMGLGNPLRDVEAQAEAVGVRPLRKRLEQSAALSGWQRVAPIADLASLWSHKRDRDE